MCDNHRIADDKRKEMACDPGRWIDEHGDALFGYALVRVRDRSVAEDLIQETLIAALSSLASYGGRATERTWLTGILRHKVIDHWRKTSRETTAGLDPTEGHPMPEAFDRKGSWSNDSAGWPADPSAVMEQKRFWEAFHCCVASLPGPLMQAYVLREMDDLDSDAICETLGISVTNLTTRLYRARMRLKSCLKGKLHEMEER